MSAAGKVISPARISSLLVPLAGLYGTGVRWKNAAFDRGMLQTRHLARPVISVGNLSVGGTGKTPLVLFLARALMVRGWNADVLSRGYRRSSDAVERVDRQGAVARYGDEPLLLARHGVPVYVGADRHAAGLLAEERSLEQKSIHLLDDGFQHRKLVRSVDIVLLRREDMKDRLLPAGRLREPLRELRRADICVLRSEDIDLRERVLPWMRQSDPARVWMVERRTVIGEEPLLPVPAMAFCGIADPQGFFRGIQDAGVRLAGTIAFRDHHAYTRRDIAQLQQAARETGAEYFVTTEKDNVRLSPALRAALENYGPLRVAELHLRLQQETEALALLVALLERSRA